MNQYLRLGKKFASWYPGNFDTKTYHTSAIGYMNGDSKGSVINEGGLAENFM